jgi:fatty acid CoA ligase FadD36
VPVFDRLAQPTGRGPVERYCSTEWLITLSTWVDGDRGAVSVGLPLAGLQTSLIDDVGGPVPHDRKTFGRLQVRSRDCSTAT